MLLLVIPLENANIRPDFQLAVRLVSHCVFAMHRVPFCAAVRSALHRLASCFPARRPVWLGSLWHEMALPFQHSANRPTRAGTNTSTQMRPEPFWPGAHFIPYGSV